jgi:microcompartment protein CcmL/EutN
MQTGAGTKYAPYSLGSSENACPAVTTVAVPGAVAGVVPATPIGVANGGPPPNDNSGNSR